VLSGAALNPTLARAASPPANVSPPEISGDPAVGQQLWATNGEWTGDPTTFSYQWLACDGAGCSAIAGATGISYTVTGAQADMTLEVQVTAGTSADLFGVASSMPTVPIPPVPTITLTSSANPAVAGTVTITAMLSFSVGGSLVFDLDGKPLAGCDQIVLASTDIGAQCAITALGAGNWDVSVQYTGNAAYLSASADLDQSVSGGDTSVLTGTATVIKTSTAAAGGGASTSGGATTGSTQEAGDESAPPAVHIAKPGPKGKPNFKLTLLTVRTGASPYQYWFAARGVRCTNRASAVLVTVHGRQSREKCSTGLQLASAALVGHQSYTLTLQAVRLSRKGKILARGRADRVNLFMPGTEVEWSPLAGATLPTGHSAKSQRGS
jgi:hypothetical protein